ncbi:DUF5680 domain-containing protein [Culicoidibacter larvae]|uniref:Helix-turn-helix transcriptional regulator n=1 Tax=Culicoidibacter larvae TaxID=2579976 RepID=A0A5R8QJ18_9FIRM|nr:DUF5680 domain-containing protein [Culicoidibacter larvae]TLG77247.1 helix-turn-helix transcriptional regulator [Culicoidibacter larvae]
MNFQEQLVELRIERGMSQEFLAEKIGVSRQAVAKWELGQAYPDFLNLLALSKVFLISIDRLVRGTEADYQQQDVDMLPAENAEVIAFLLRAKKATYAGHGGEATSSRPASHDLQYAEGELVYIDSYLGSSRFAGEEALWRERRPFWSMNYVGRVLSDDFSSAFLKEALAQVPSDQPYRGPLIYRNGVHTYHCTIQGDFEWFQGHEEIYCNNIKTYECYFHGGLIV